jgi:hypothetical protein
MDWLAEVLGWATAESWPQTALGTVVGIGALTWLIYTDFSTTVGRVSIVVVPLLVGAVLVWGRLRFGKR